MGTDDGITVILGKLDGNDEGTVVGRIDGEVVGVRVGRFEGLLDGDIVN